MGTTPASPTYGSAMTMTEFQHLVAFIKEHHAFGECGKMIKYMHPTIDFRTMSVFRVNFRGFFDPIEEGKTFDFRDNAQPLLHNIMAWLNPTADGTH